MNSGRAFFKKHGYIRILLIMSAIVLMLVGIFSVFLSYTFSNYAVEEISKVNKQELHHTVANAEFLLEKLRAYAITLYEDPDIRAWLAAQTDTPLLFINATHRLSKFLPMEPLIKRVCLVNMRNRALYDSTTGLCSFDTLADQGLLALLTQARPTLKVIHHSFDGEVQLVMIAPASPVPQDYNGYIVLTLDSDVFKTYMTQNNNNPNVQTFILADGTIPLTETIEDETIAALNNKTHIRTADGGYELTLGNEKWLTHSEPLKKQEWDFYRLMRLEDINQNTIDFRNVLLISLFSMLALILVMLIWYSRRTLKPLGGLAQQVQDLMTGDISSDAKKDRTLPEYGVIAHGIEALQSKVASLDMHKGLITADYIRQWILQGHMTYTIQTYLQKETSLLSYRFIHLAVFRLESFEHLRESYDFASIKRIKQSVGALAKEHLLFAGGWPSESIDMGTDCIVMLIGSDDDVLKPLKDAISAICALCEKRYMGSLRLAVAISGAKRKGDDLKQTYDSIYEISMLKFIWGEEKVYEEADYEIYMQSVQVLPNDNNLDEIIKDIRVGDLDKAFSRLDSIISQMQVMTYASCKFYLTLCIYTIFKAFSRHTSLRDFVGIQRQLEMFNSLSDAAAWLQTEIMKISGSIGLLKKTGRREEAMLEIIEYVETNLQNPMLTLDDIADHVSLSVRYIRQLFKDAFGTTLSEYILEKRIARVTDLLETTDWPVSDIAEHAGFISKSHFFTVFKKTTGVTPNQYRQAPKRSVPAAKDEPEA